MSKAIKPTLVSDALDRAGHLNEIVTFRIYETWGRIIWEYYRGLLRDDLRNHTMDYARAQGDV